LKFFITISLEAPGNTCGDAGSLRRAHACEDAGVPGALLFQGVARFLSDSSIGFLVQFDRKLGLLRPVRKPSLK